MLHVVHRHRFDASSENVCSLANMPPPHVGPRFPKSHTRIVSTSPTRCKPPPLDRCTSDDIHMSPLRPCGTACWQPVLPRRTASRVAYASGSQHELPSRASRSSCLSLGTGRRDEGNAQDSNSLGV